MRAFDARLYLVTDPGMVPPERLVPSVLAAVKGGVTVVQLRDKLAGTRVLLESARALLDALAPFGVPLLVNDRADVALAAGAHGLHLGQTDLPLEDARRIMGEGAIIGLSIETLPELDGTEAADYLAASPVFSTPTKTDTAPAHGLDGVAALAARTERPLVGIGGIDHGNAADVIRAGATGVAVVSAVLRAGDPEDAARRLRRAIDGALEPTGGPS